MARAVERSVPGLRVRAVTGGWTVGRPTGATTVRRTVSELLSEVEPDDGRRAALLNEVLAAADAAAAMVVDQAQPASMGGRVTT